MLQHFFKTNLKLSLFDSSIFKCFLTSNYFMCRLTLLIVTAIIKNKEHCGFKQRGATIFEGRRTLKLRSLIDFKTGLDGGLSSMV